MQPGPVQMERIITRVEQELAVQQQSTRSTGSPQAPRLAPPAIQGDHLRQWQQFMAASKATEVRGWHTFWRSLQYAVQASLVAPPSSIRLASS